MAPSLKITETVRVALRRKCHTARMRQELGLRIGDPGLEGTRKWMHSGGRKRRLPIRTAIGLARELSLPLIKLLTEEQVIDADVIALAVNREKRARRWV